jgi:exoribonuclease-2
MLHAFAFCYHAQQLRAVWVAGAEGGDQLRLVRADGVAFRYRARQILHRWDEEGPALDDATAPAFIAARVAALEEQAQGLDLARLHAALPVDVEWPMERLAELALPPGSGSPARAALFLALMRDSTRFRRGESGFAARSREQQQARLARVDEAAAREAWVAKAGAWVEALERGSWLGGGDPEGLKFLVQLTSLLALDKRSPHWAVLARPLGLHALHAHDAAPKLKTWLERADGWPGWPAIWLLRAGVYQGFAPGLVDLARELSAAPLREAGRRDFRDVPTYTLDAIDTFDYDDAYSVLESGAQGLTVAVHIAEAPPELEPGHPLFDAAAARISSVYTPGAVFPMFPPALSLGRWSLRKGEPRETVSLVLRLGSAGAELAGIERGLIRVGENLDYARAEELIRQEPQTWGRLARLAEALTQARIGNGAVVTVRREVSVNPSDASRVVLKPVSRHGGVHRVIEELAIAYNTAIGRYCRDQRLPAIYRVQGKRHSTPAPGLTAQPMLPPARYSLHGGRHAGLGADRYIHTTSPLRRFPDLVMQRQVIEHAVSGRVTFADPALLDGWVSHAESRQSAYDEVERAIDEHWVRVYLTQNPGLTLQATVRKNEHGHGRVWLEDVMVAAEANLPPYARPGGQLTVRVTEVDLDAQRVRVEAV